MTGHVAGKSVLVTGAGGGFGRLTSEKLAALGARLTCVDVDGEAAAATASAIREAGGQAIAVAADVAKLDDMRAAAAAAVAAYGAIDVLVNNAGIMPLAFLADHASAHEAWSRCIDVNLKGVMNGVVAVHDQMIAQGRGHVVNLSSIYGNFPSAGAAVYGATKAAVDYFSGALRHESRGRIKVTVVKPTGVLSTGLASTVVNAKASAGILGQHAGEFYEDLPRVMGPGAAAPGDWNDAENIGYLALAPEHVADAIVHVIDQPWGVAISDVTVRASADHYVR